MLDGSRDPDGEINVRGDYLARLTDLIVVGNVARVHRGTRRSDRGSQFVGQALKDLKVLAALHATTTGNNDPRGGQLGPFRCGQLLPDKARQAGLFGRLDRLDR